MEDRLSIFGEVEYREPGDAPQAAKQFHCKRPECDQPIKIMAFNEPDSYCSVNCEKLDTKQLTEEELKLSGVIR